MRRCLRCARGAASSPPTRATPPGARSSRRSACTPRSTKHAAGPTTALAIRLHGDYHLGQVLVTRNDFVITDLEGEPGRSLAERRRKHSVVKDLAAMGRSFDYARVVAAQQFAAKPARAPPMSARSSKTGACVFMRRFATRTEKRSATAGCCRATKPRRSGCCGSRRSSGCSTRFATSYAPPRARNGAARRPHRVARGVALPRAGARRSRRPRARRRGAPAAPPPAAGR